MRILITGVGREGQIGEALAREFASAGGRLALVDRAIERVEARANALGGAAAGVHAFAGDLTDRDAVGRIVASAHDALGGLDAVVCAAGGFAMSGPVDGDAEWDRMMAVNLATAYATTRAALPLLRASRGTLVYFTSPSAMPGGAIRGMAAYAAAKAGVVALMRAVAADERAHGVRANAVALNAVRTAANVAAMGDAHAYVEREDVARVVAWLASSASAPVTGEIVRLG